MKTVSCFFVDRFNTYSPYFINQKTHIILPHTFKIFTAEFIVKKQ